MTEEVTEGLVEEMAVTTEVKMVEEVMVLHEMSTSPLVYPVVSCQILFVPNSDI